MFRFTGFFKSRIPIVCLLLTPVFAIYGQTRGNLNGKVTAAAGGPVPSAAVNLIGTESNERRNAVTGPDGTFSLSDVAQGSYRLEVEAQGFKRTSQQNIQIVAGQPVRVDIRLEPGSSSETVLVQGQVSLLQDDSAQVARAYTTRTVRELPLVDRNVLQLVELMPGVTPPSLAEQPVLDPQRNRFWQTNGQPFWANRQMTDGVENDERFLNIPIHTQPLENIAQLNLITSNYDASEGRAGGTIVNVVTRSGTNQMHGSLFAFNNNSAVGARDYFDPKGLEQARYNKNQFGASLGGPIKRDHTFFFLNYEGDYFRNRKPVVTTVPNAQFLTGDFSAVPNFTLYNPATGLPFSNNVIPSSLISPISRSLLGYFPQANGLGFENNYFTAIPQFDDGNRADAKLDHRFGNNAGFFLRWGYSNYRAVEGSAFGSPLQPTYLSRLRSHNAQFGLNGNVHGFSADLRAAYNRYEDPIFVNSAATLGSSFGFTNPNLPAGTATLPSLQIAGLSALGSQAAYPQRNYDNNFNVATNWGIQTRGNNLKFGADLWLIRVDGFATNQYGPQGGYVFGSGATTLPGASTLGQSGEFPSAFAAFLLGAPSQIGAGATPYASNYQYQTSGYIDDKIRPFSRLTLDLGVRYDFFTPLQPRKAAGLSVYDPITNNLLPVGQGGIDRRGNVAYDTNNIAPRVGFALRLRETTAIRGGYGLSYFQRPLQFDNNSFISSQTGLSLGTNGGFGVAGAFGAIPLIGSAIGAAAPNNGVYFTQRDVQTPYVQTYNFQIQQDLRYGIVADIGYVGNTGRQLPYLRELNAAQPGTGVAGLPFYSQFGRTGSVLQSTSGLTSNYNSLQVNLTKRFSQGIGFAVAYTYSKALDYGSGFSPLLNSLNVRQNYGPADFDRTHLLTVSHVWQLPFGTGAHYLKTGALGHVLGPWQLNGIFRYATGSPFTPLADSLACNCPGNVARADVNYLGQTNVLSYQPTFYGYLPYFYSYANYGFGQPAAGQLGNAGRNILRTENIANYDLSLFRSFVFVEGTKLEARAEAYNLANSPHFGAPVPNVNSASFGQYTSTLPGLGLGSRALQFGLRLVF